MHKTLYILVACCCILYTQVKNVIFCDSLTTNACSKLDYFSQHLTHVRGSLGNDLDNAYMCTWMHNCHNLTLHIYPAWIFNLSTTFNIQGSNRLYKSDYIICQFWLFSCLLLIIKNTHLLLIIKNTQFSVS